ncbi:MAG: transcriptional regulator [Pseudomonadota bacterium]
MAPEERWLSGEEIAVHMGVSKETVYRWLDCGTIRALTALGSCGGSKLQKWASGSGMAAPQNPLVAVRKEVGVNGS